MNVPQTTQKYVERGACRVGGCKCLRVKQWKAGRGDGPLEKEVNAKADKKKKKRNGNGISRVLTAFY